jgi:helix-turn-helix, Psq domain
VVYQDVGHIMTSDTLTEFPTPFIPYVFSPFSIMSIIIQETKIILAIEAIRMSKKLSCRKTTKLYQVSYSIFCNRINSRIILLERRLANIKLIILEEEVIIHNILDIDSRGFVPRLASIKDIANYILKSREGRYISKL